MNIDIDLTTFIQQLSCKCTKTQKKTFSKGEIITTYIAKRNQICILVNGHADLIRYDFNGRKTIIEHFIQNDIFGELFYSVNTNNELFVVAGKKCDVLFLSYDNISQKCKTKCDFHEKLFFNLHTLILNKIIDLNTRIELLTKRTIREKLLSYFSILSTRQFSKTFILPFSFTDLADYLSIDRSAMMREIKTLKDEGFIKKKDNKITLLY